MVSVLGLAATIFARQQETGAFLSNEALGAELLDRLRMLEGEPWARVKRLCRDRQGLALAVAYAARARPIGAPVMAGVASLLMLAGQAARGHHR